MWLSSNIILYVAAHSLETLNTFPFRILAAVGEPQLCRMVDPKSSSYPTTSNPGSNNPSYTVPQTD